MKTRLLYQFWLLSLGTLLFLVGCANAAGAAGVRLMWREMSVPGHVDAHYHTFSGMEERGFEAERGQELKLDYKLDIEKGALSLSIFAPDDSLLWQVHHQQDASDSMPLYLPADGDYRLRVEGVETGGGFDLTWVVD
ncbi:MAG: hypothetical protein R3300_01215 [Candidatus Promineifilaceae bacterium]|nr:hypothetical protein [Candidatus Promineifilaceae bacterium]